MYIAARAILPRGLLSNIEFEEYWSAGIARETESGESKAYSEDDHECPRDGKDV